MFQLAERLGEADIPKLAALPAPQLLHWQAYLLMQAAPHDPLPANKTFPRRSLPSPALSRNVLP